MSYPCKWCQTRLTTTNGRYSHQSRCPLNPKRDQANEQQTIDPPVKQSFLQSIQNPTELDPFDEYMLQMQNQGDNAEEAPDSDPEYVDDAEQPQQAERRLNLHAIKFELITCC